MKHCLLFSITFLLFQSLTFAQDGPTIEWVGTYHTGIFDEGAAEIAAYDPQGQLVFFTNADANAIGILSIADPSAPLLIGEVDMSAYGGGVNSVAYHNGYVAIAVEADTKQDNGSVVILNTDGEWVATYEVGALPDMLTFNHSGDRILVANEGEPNDEYTIDPNGSVSVIDISSGASSGAVHTISFEAYNDKKGEVIAKGIRIFGPNASVAQDLEPEFVTVTPDDEYAFVVCQENNAMAKIDLKTYEIVELFPLGLKDHRFEGQGLDASNRVDDIQIKNWPVFGMYQPDAIDSYTAANGRQYIVTANEGDARDYDGFSEEARVKDLVLNTTNYPNADELQEDENLGRLKTTTASGDINGDGVTDLIHSYGTRSFTIWDTDCKLIWDSGDQFEQILATEDPANFNSTNDDNDSYKNRSDDKGPEPEAIIAFSLFGDAYVVVGLERMGGMLLYNVSDPEAPVFVDYMNNRNFDVDAESMEAGDLGIEDITYVAPNYSPIGQPLLITANEVSGTISLFKIASDLCDISSTVTTAGGSDFIERCVGDVLVDVAHEAEEDGSYWCIITDEANNILGYSNRSDGDQVDLSAAPDGVCRIWGWSTDGTILPEIGTPAGTLNMGCNNLSDNFIQVYRIAGGTCADDNGCSTPSNISHRQSDKNRYSLRWDRVSEANSYEIRLVINDKIQPGLITVRSNRITVTSGSSSKVAIQIRTVCGIRSRSLYSDAIEIPSISNTKSYNIGEIEIFEEFDPTVAASSGISPNPFDQSINYTVSIDKASSVATYIADVTGKTVLRSANNQLGAGIHNISFETAHLQPGVYFFTIEKEGVQTTEKIVKF